MAATITLTMTKAEYKQIVDLARDQIVYGNAEWDTVKSLGSYNANGAVEMLIEKTTIYGITFYRWASDEDSGKECFEIAKAIEGAKKEMA